MRFPNLPLVRAFTCVVFLASAVPCAAQRYVVSVDGLGLFRERVGLAAERSFADRFAARLSYESQTYRTGRVNGTRVYTVKGRGVIPEVRYYPAHRNKPAPFGFFAGASFRYVTVTETYDPLDIAVEGKVLNYTFVCGYKLKAGTGMVEFLGGYGGGKVTGLAGSARDRIDPYLSGDTVDYLEGGFRFEISFGLCFPRPGKVKADRHDGAGG